MSAEPVAVWSREPQDRPGTHLVVLLHGHGSHEEDLMGLVPGLPEEYTYVSLLATLALEHSGYTWFDVDIERLAYRSQDARDAVQALGRWIDEVSSGHASVTLLGFSMGMAMATSLARSRPEDFAAVVGLSGFAVDPAGESEVEEFFDDHKLAAVQVPLFWGRDQEDPVIPPENIEYTLNWARDHVKLTKVLYAGAGHGVVPQEVSHVGEFLQYILGRS